MDPKSVISEVRIRTADLLFREGILFIRILPEVDMDIADVTEIYNAGLKLADGKPYCALADARTNPVSSPEARAFGATEGYSKYRLADAILVDSTAMKLVVNFYIAFNKPKVPTRMFSKEEEAVRWLKSFLP
ncbi:MAG: hypothetical protein ACHQRM_12960 [Bacteroidia bacterium]